MRRMPVFAICLKQLQHGDAVTYTVAPSMFTPFFAACRIAFDSAWIVATQWPSSIMWPTSEQWGMPRIEPLYPVDRIVRFRTMTAPTYLRGQVERVDTTCAMLMKYSSHDARGRSSSGMRHILADAHDGACGR